MIAACLTSPVPHQLPGITPTPQYSFTPKFSSQGVLWGDLNCDTSALLSAWNSNFSYLVISSGIPGSPSLNIAAWLRASRASGSVLWLTRWLASSVTLCLWPGEWVPSASGVGPSVSSGWHSTWHVVGVQQIMCLGCHHDEHLQVLAFWA